MKQMKHKKTFLIMALLLGSFFPLLANANPVPSTSPSPIPTPSITLNSSSAEVTEGQGPVLITVIRSHGFETSSVWVKTNPISALAGTDYEAFDTQVVFQPKETQKTVAVNIVDDQIPESNETFSVTLRNATFGEIRSPSTQTITIRDNDAPQFGEYRFELSSVNVREDYVVYLRIVRVNGSYGAGIVEVSTIDGTAIQGKDYLFSTRQISFQNGETEKYVSVPLIHDRLREGPETFQIVLKKLTERGTLGTPNVVGVTIVDID